MNACTEPPDPRAALAAELLEDSGFVDAFLASESVPRDGCVLRVEIVPGNTPTVTSYALRVQIQPRHRRTTLKREPATSANGP